MKSVQMLTTSKQQNVDLWEVWVDLQTSTHENGGTLFLIGDVFITDDLVQPYFQKKAHSNPKVLSLELVPGITSEDGFVAEVMYSEDLQHSMQYSEILIYSGDEVVAHINDIEVLA